MAGVQTLPLDELPLLDPHSTVSFEKLMRLERLDDNTFGSLTRPFVPGAKHLGFARAYGGHVYAQSAWAAAQTLNETSNFLLHNISGYFLRRGNPNIPFVYNVQRVRDGRQFCMRRVDVMQGPAGICFTCICSFKLPEPDQLDFQPQVNPWKEFAAVLGGKKIEDHPDHPSVDTRSFNAKPASARGPPDYPPFLGLKSLKVDMTAYNADRAPQARRQINFYSVIGTLPTGPRAANLHAAAHLYACDRNSLSVVDRHLDVDEFTESQSSLSYTVTLHGCAATELDMLDGKGKPRWFLHETWVDRLTDGRGMHHSKIYDLDGKHIVTATQDGMVRLKFDTLQQQHDVHKALKIKASTKL